MAQTSPPPGPDLPADSDPPRPLPRRATPRPQAARANRPRFGPLDALWTVLLALTAAGLSLHFGYLSGRHTLGSLAGVGIVASLYLLGWRARDRAAGVSAGLLAATSPLFLESAAYSPHSALFLLLTLAALFAFVAGSSLAALALAAAATLVRPDGLLLGLLLLGLSLAQGRKRAWLGAIVLLGPVIAGEAGRIALGYGPPSWPTIGVHREIWRRLATPAVALLAWLLIPFCAEYGEAQRRARWLPVVLWAALSVLTATLLMDTTAAGMRLPLIVMLFALAGGGLSRLLPTLAGELPGPVPRYVLATLAVLGLVSLHVRLEMPLVHHFPTTFGTSK